MKNYIGSQQHWEDSVNADYDERERGNKEQVDKQEQPDNRVKPYLLTIKDKELDALFQRILPPHDYGEDANVQELYNRIIDLESKNTQLEQGIKKFVHHWRKYFDSPKVGQPPVLSDLENLLNI